MGPGAWGNGIGGRKGKLGGRNGLAGAAGRCGAVTPTGIEKFPDQSATRFACNEAFATSCAASHGFLLPSYKSITEMGK